MESRAQNLAARFAAVNQELIEFVACCSNADWKTPCVAEGWSAGVTVHHIATDYPAVLDVIAAIAGSSPAPEVTREVLDHRNARHAQQFAQCTRSETASLLQRNGAAVMKMIVRLSDEQLQRSGNVLGRDLSVGTCIEDWLIGHIRRHLESIRMSTRAANDIQKEAPP